MVENAEVVILGGGEVNLGFERYDAMGGYFFDDYDRFKNYLHRRQNTGKFQCPAVVRPMGLQQSSGRGEQRRVPDGYSIDRVLAGDQDHSNILPSARQSQSWL